MDKSSTRPRGARPRAGCRSPHGPAPREQEYLVYQARNTAAQEWTAGHAKKTMLAGTPGAGLFQSIVTIRGYAPDTPYGVIATYTPPQSRYAEWKVLTS